MINHGRTLLLNRDGDKRPSSDYFLEEYVDPGFKALALPSALSTLHRTLTGVGSDNAFANYRMFQFTKLLHSTEFSEYVTALDPRVTYLRGRSIATAEPSQSVTAITGPTAGTTLSLIGALEHHNRLLHTWELEIIDANTAHSTFLQTGSPLVKSITFDGNVTSPIPLAEQSGFYAMLATPAVPVGAKWRIEVFTLPVLELAELELELRNVASAASSSIFPSEEPYKTFQSLWEKHPYLQYRLSGLLLAFIYSAERIRLNG